MTTWPKSKVLGWADRRAALDAGERARFKARGTRKSRPMTWFTFTCDGCGVEFKRKKQYVTRAAKLGYKIRFCSWYCPRKGRDK
jgi:ribosomal protein L44E